MKDLTAPLAELRHLTRTASDLGEVAAHFHDHLGNTVELHRGSRAVPQPRLLLAVEASLQHALGAEHRLKETAVFRYQDTDFFHGAGLIRGTLAVFFLFEDARQGLAILNGVPTHLTRFTLLDVPPGVGPAPAARGRS